MALVDILIFWSLLGVVFFIFTPVSSENKFEIILIFIISGPFIWMLLLAIVTVWYLNNQPPFDKFDDYD